MSDARLRELERRFRATGTVADEAAWLLERARAGELTRDRLEIAAYCGHPAAGLAVEAGPADPGDPMAWLEGLERWGAAPVLRALVEALDADRPGWPEAERPRVEAALALGPDRIEDWLRLAGEARRATAGLSHRGTVLLLALDRLAEQRRYLDLDDPEAASGLDRLVDRFQLTDPERWRYTRTVRDPRRSWVHVFIYRRPKDEREVENRIEATPGWSPPPGSERRPPDRPGLLAGFSIPLLDPGPALAAARAALGSWALGGPSP